MHDCWLMQKLKASSCRMTEAMARPGSRTAQMHGPVCVKLRVSDVAISACYDFI